ncbi:MAG: hypothetical protein IJ635_06660 [Bacteroidaceae bacterium]|nr:hypothetical protein [Bacteroidaceae bacterium]
MGEAMVKQLDKKKSASPIGDIKTAREVSLPQPIASLACSGLLDEIEETYIGQWNKGEVLIIYAEDETPASNEKIQSDHELYAKYYNALMFGNLTSIVTTGTHIGFIKQGNKTKKNHRHYVELIGAELLDEPIDIKPDDATLYKTHLAKYRNITLEDGIIKIPVSEMAWEILESEKFLSFYWEKKFDGLVLSLGSFDYLFFTNKAQKHYSVKKEEDGEDENAIYHGTNKDGIAFLCFDLSLMEEQP